MLQCPNHQCQASNAESNQFCCQCNTPLPKRYLWGAGFKGNRLKPGERVADRYRYTGTQVFLDLKPGMPPNGAEPLTPPPSALPYLRLINYRLHLPQIHGWLAAPPSPQEGELLLLYDAAIYQPSIYTDADPSSGLPGGQDRLNSAATAQPESGMAAERGSPVPLPRLSDAWGTASPWRRLNWLWQIAQLWQPLRQEQVASSLLSSRLLRVEGALVRLLELRHDGIGAGGSRETAPTLGQLGHLCRDWIVADAPDSDFLTALCQQLIEGRIEQPNQLIELIEAAMAELSPSRTQSVLITTQTDRGPSRSRNEDACFPPSGAIMSYRGDRTPTNGDSSPPTIPGQPELNITEMTDEPVVIVCDGIGGHQGGDIASQLAIHSICDHLIEQTQGDTSEDTGGVLGVFRQLSNAIYDANDLISQRNDGEQRRDRQRMGTTLVMALIDGYDCYISHVGDSRAYWITRWGCHQITLDDDVASREVRLGYDTHAHALHRPGSGSLIQALGMADSVSLHPTVQRVLLDGAGLLLLCSDGLSDNDLVEVFWRSTLLPVLAGELDLTTAREALINTANTQNGYDNVTVGLVHWQITPPPSSAARTLSLDAIPPPEATARSTRLQAGQDSISPTSALHQSNQTKLLTPPDGSSDHGAGSAADSSSTPRTNPVAPVPLKVDLRRSSGVIPLLGGIAILLGIASLLVYTFIPSVGDWLSRRSAPPSETDNSAPPLTDTEGGTEGIRDGVSLSVGSTLRIGSPSSSSRSTLLAYAEPRAATELNSAPESEDPPPDTATSGTVTPIGYIAPGTLVQVLGRSEFSQTVSWVELKVCKLPGSSTTAIASSETSSATALQPGQAAWLSETALTSFSLESAGAEITPICAPPTE